MVNILGKDIKKEIILVHGDKIFNKLYYPRQIFLDIDTCLLYRLDQKAKTTDTLNSVSKTLIAGGGSTGGAIKVRNFYATYLQTTYAVTGKILLDKVDVEGIGQRTDLYTISGDTVTFNEGLQEGTWVTLYYYE